MAKTTAKRIGIIGQGNVGQALERGLTGAGYEVQTAGRDGEEVQSVGEWADILFLAVPYGERENAIDELGDAVEGKTIVDVTNALDDAMEYAGNADQSGAEELQEILDDANVVKAFNTVFAQYMDQGAIGDQPLTLFVAGDDKGARDEVIALGEAIGFDPVDSGPLQNARYLEAIGYFNIQLAHTLGHGPASGFRYLHETSQARNRGTRPTSGTARTDKKPKTLARNR